MNYLQVINIENSIEWDRIVTSFKCYDVNYLSGYVKAFYVHGDGEPLLFYYDDGNTRGINVVMKRDIGLASQFKDKIPIKTLFDLSTPYGYGGFWIEGNNYDAINKTYNRYCIEHGYVSEFVRFHLFSNFNTHYDGLSETHIHNVVRNLELPIDEMLMDFEHKVRKNIKKALNNGLEILIDTTGQRLNEFLKIYYGTMNRSNANENYYFSKDFFLQLNQMVGNYVYIHVLHENKIISTELVIYGTENCYSFLGGTDQDYFNLRPNDFLKFEIIKWAKEQGLKRFILGGGYGDDDGIFRYKKSLAPNGIVDFYIGKKIFDQETYEKLLEIRSQDTEFIRHSSYFPLYRS